MIDVIFDASSDINDYIARQIIEQNYLRLQFKLDRSWTGKRLSDDMDDASQENIRNLIEAADAYVKNSQAQKAIASFLQNQAR
ncbi:MAG: hypothetical protein F6K28_36495 [Microcoleus sp. SIO2G3]|nr:hypothetical protein [Microcoleus sp. SIO2G3]